jgi:hypothetical protein
MFEVLVELAVAGWWTLWMSGGIKQVWLCRNLLVLVATKRLAVPGVLTQHARSDGLTRTI